MKEQLLDRIIELSKELAVWENDHYALRSKYNDLKSKHEGTLHQLAETTVELQDLKAKYENDIGAGIQGEIDKRPAYTDPAAIGFMR